MLALSVLVVLALCGVAQAAVPGVVPAGSIKAEGPLGVAVDQSNEDLYLGNFIHFLTPEGFGESQNNEKFDASGKLLSQFGGEGLYAGAAVNPTNRDVYILNSLKSEIYTYDPNGNPSGLPQFPVPASGNFSFFGSPFTAVQIASDSAGNVYVPVASENEVLEYPPNGGTPLGTPSHTFTGSGSLNGPVGVAVDTAGNVWVADTGNNRIVELDPSDAVIGEIPSEGVQAVALDAQGHVFAIVFNGADPCGSLNSPCDHLVEYSSTGAQLADSGAGEFGLTREQLLTGSLSMLAVDDATGRVYVTDDAKGLVWMFAQPTAPHVESESEVAVEVGTSEAKLGARVNAGGIDARYRFEYGTTTAYGHSVPLPEGDAGTGLTAHTVWAAASGLAPGTIYHYRVVATNELGDAKGADQTFTTETTAQAGCPNEQSRTGFAAALPDCRAYELVVAPDPSGAEPDPYTKDGNPRSALDGNVAGASGGWLAFKANDVLPGSPSTAQFYVATRGVNGWSTQNETPPQNYYGYKCNEEPSSSFITAYSADLSRAVLAIGGNPECGGPEPELVSGEPQGVENLFVRDNAHGSYQLVDVTPPGVIATGAGFVAGSADLGHVVFQEQAKLTDNALDNVDNLYDWTGGVVRLVTVLPDETPVAGSFAGISADGSRIFFTQGGNLYARVNGVRTVQIDASEVGGSGGGGSFQGASADGSQMFFIDADTLTKGATAEPGRPDLYRYDFNAPEGERLTDLTVNSGEAANVTGVQGIDEDGAHVYFTAEGVLTGSEGNGRNETAQGGQLNLYVYHGGTITFITHSAGGTRVSRNGAFLAFTSTVSLTGYDNIDVKAQESDSEIYLYDTTNKSIVCASCNPSGESPTSSIGFETEGHQPHPIAEDGRVFFQTDEALLPADTNGQQDVYEFEPDGVGTCHSAAGCVFLISTGTSSFETQFIDASASGSDVYLLEYQKLVPQDKQEEARTIYDARADGGFPELAASPSCTTADACRSAPAPQPSIFGAPSSQTFSGAGNAAAPVVKKKAAKKKASRCRKGFVKKKGGKCVKGKAGKARRSLAKRAGYERRPKR